MELHPSVDARLARLAPDQRAAATAPPGPVLCVAPAGSGKTTTLVARIAWLVATGVDPGTICAVTFNRRAATELATRLDEALAPLGVAPGGVRVRTFHGLGREILRASGRQVDQLVDRATLLRELHPTAGPAVLRSLDDAFSRIKLDLGLTAAAVADLVDAAAHVDAAPAEDATDPARPVPGLGVAAAFVAYEDRRTERGALDFDDLVVEALRLLERDEAARVTWRRACEHLLVDEVQDVDRTQLELALLLAAPANRIFLVGDDDQSIYGWRLADVRRVLAIDHRLPGLRRVHLVTNYRCPGPVVERAVRLVAHNAERFEKEIAPRAGATGRLVLAPDPTTDDAALRRFLAAPLEADRTRAVLARTNGELLPALAAALELELRVRASGLRLLLTEPGIETLLGEAEAMTDAGLPLLRRLASLAGTRGANHTPTAMPDEDQARGEHAPRPGRTECLRALLAWAPPYRSLETFAAAVRSRREAMARLDDSSAPLILATAHGTKGLEFDEVAVVGLDEGRFPSHRSMDEAPDPERALEEERRLAYVAWTRARRSLTLIYDPAAPSRFLLEAFSPAELGLAPGSGALLAAADPAAGPSGRRAAHPGAKGVDRRLEVRPHRPPIRVVEPARLDAIE